MIGKRMILNSRSDFKHLFAHGSGWGVDRDLQQLLDRCSPQLFIGAPFNCHPALLDPSLRSREGRPTTACDSDRLQLMGFKQRPLPISGQVVFIFEQDGDEAS